MSEVLPIHPVQELDKTGPIIGNKSPLSVSYPSALPFALIEGAAMTGSRRRESKTVIEFQQ